MRISTQDFVFHNDSGFDADVQINVGTMQTNLVPQENPTLGHGIKKSFDIFLGCPKLLIDISSTSIRFIQQRR